MSPSTIAPRPRAIRRTRRALIIAMLALSVTSVSCGSSPSDAEVQGVVEVQGAAEVQGVVVEVDDTSSSEVGLIEAVCITNTPTHEPC